MRVRFTPAARARLLEIITHIRQEDPAAAKRFRRRVEHVLRRLEEFPHSGRPLPERPDLPHREVIVRPYRFFYRARGRDVWIVAVWHAAQLPEDPPE